MVDVIVLDGNQRSALAAVRAFGAAGLSVKVGAESRESLASVSRCCCSKFEYTSPFHDPQGFLKTVLEVIRNEPGSILLPMTDVTMNEVLRHQNLISRYATVPFADYDTYRALSNKGLLFKAAQNLGVPMPQTEFVDSTEARERLRTKSDSLVYPLVLKPYESRVRTEFGWVGTQVKYVHSCQDIIDYVSRQENPVLPFMVQERIQGPGIGIFLLMSKGQVLAEFAHQRIREKPPSGGVSVVCKSIEPPVDALESAKKLLQHFNWTGVAMVEFKRDSRDGMCKLMEVNARFWGSLQLAILSGVNFPYLLYLMACKSYIHPQLVYKTNVISRWELGDLDHLVIRLKKNINKEDLTINSSSNIALLFSFIFDFINFKVKHEVFNLKDPKPFFNELKSYIKYIFVNKTYKNKSI